MEFDFSQLDGKQKYKLLTATVIPRPIALVSAVDKHGRMNAAPYSFFNMFAEDPATCVLGIQRRPDGRPKDTAHLIREEGEFVINMVDMNIAEGMNITAIEFEPEYDEIALAGFTPAPSKTIKAPRILEAPVSFECRRTVTMQLSAERDIVVGEVLYMHVREGLIDPDTFYLNRDAYDAVGRLYADLYAPLRDVFSMRRQTAEEFLMSSGHDDDPEKQ
ncbi:MAG: flavin reductase family protein [Alphaproteobacteria bacterium]|nr:flavin reductase family protein [Alphaproteobacteria bacterium]